MTTCFSKNIKPFCPLFMGLSGLFEKNIGFYVIFFLKKLNPSLGKREGKIIRFVESYDLGARQKIVLLEVNEERFLVGVGPNQISLLSKVEKQKIEAADLNKFSDWKIVAEVVWFKLIFGMQVLCRYVYS